MVRFIIDSRVHYNSCIYRFKTQQTLTNVYSTMESALKSAQTQLEATPAHV